MGMGILKIVLWGWVYEIVERGKGGYLQCVEIAKIGVYVLLSIGRMKAEGWGSQ